MRKCLSILALLTISASTMASEGPPPFNILSCEGGARVYAQSEERRILTLDITDDAAAVSALMFDNGKLRPETLGYFYDADYCDESAFPDVCRNTRNSFLTHPEIAYSEPTEVTGWANQGVFATADFHGFLDQLSHGRQVRVVRNGSELTAYLFDQTKGADIASFHWTQCRETNYRIP